MGNPAQARVLKLLTEGVTEKATLPALAVKSVRNAKSVWMVYMVILVRLSASQHRPAVEMDCALQMEHASAMMDGEVIIVISAVLRMPEQNAK